MSGKNVRGFNYSTEEDVVLAKAWVHVSEDPNVGSEQKGNTFYTKVWNEYKQAKPGELPLRPLASTSIRVKTILKHCVRFSACHSTVVGSKPTGVNDAETIRMTTSLFKGKKINDPQEDIGRPFKPPTSQSTKRPVGRRKAKEIAQKQHSANKKIKIAQEAVKAQQNRNTALSRQKDILLFTNGPGGVHSKQAQEFFSLMQEEALEALRDRAAARKSKRAFTELSEGSVEDYTQDGPTTGEEHPTAPSIDLLTDVTSPSAGLDNGSGALVCPEDCP
ncbi:hypothetical protein BWQ96_05176 [Gracilariopsis chorda]|uniref:No apical meristem-associated C-terminal domain-containing protein n=1 Tax=Gracilariopsis chorda TaxID=448386 RepID=A0A2V3ISJ3_9FLOR|nr:hypothetical protein BWQ96_05176 [Gracilariopsis chorda]|eukprot:PXF45074.1 hypothetical protein BWQ96_05176 [Gracilariopsis chorda]